MKNITYIIYSLCFLLLFSCKKDGELASIHDVTPPKLSSDNAKDFVLLEDKADTDSITLRWEAANYGYSASVTYTLEFAKASDAAFENPVFVSILSQNYYRASVGKFNELLNRLGLETETVEPIIYRLKSTISPTYPMMISDASTFNVTTFSTEIIYPKVYVPGSHQGWDPATAPILTDVTFKGIYEGYINLPEASNEFKLTTVPGWTEPDYGSPAEGKLIMSGGSNIKFAGPGHFLMTVDLPGLTYKLVPMNFGIVGDAVGSWDVDQDMIYDLPSKTLRLTTKLVVGSMKFRANDEWVVNLGSTNEENILAQGGENISITEAGTYEITLDLNDPLVKKYKLVKK